MIFTSYIGKYGALDSERPKGIIQDKADVLDIIGQTNLSFFESAKYFPFLYLVFKFSGIMNLKDAELIESIESNTLSQTYLKVLYSK